MSEYEKSRVKVCINCLLATNKHSIKVMFMVNISNNISKNRIRLIG